MFVVSLSKRNLKKILIFCIGIVVAVTVAIVFFMGLDEESNTDMTGGVSTLAKTENDIHSFISSFGWETDVSPVEVRQVAIPESFDEVYKNYNQIQLSQGFDLRKYAGVSVKRWTYIIRNYPGTSAEDDFIRINILVYDNEIIGGDVCSVKLDGFMHGFKAE